MNSHARCGDQGGVAHELGRPANHAHMASCKFAAMIATRRLDPMNKVETSVVLLVFSQGRDQEVEPLGLGDGMVLGVLLRSPPRTHSWSE
jgi:hypothetical protein